MQAATNTNNKQAASGIRKSYRDLLKHSGIYGIGQVLSRLASFLLLPVYTNYLRPADYGSIAILDLTASVLAILIGGGMGAAITRYHFDASDEIERCRIWWTGLTCVAFVGTVVVVPAWLFRDVLAHLTLGATVEQGGFYYALVLPTLWLAVLEKVLDCYLRVRKWSGLSVGVNLARLLFNIGLNVYFLVGLRLGITGILLGNLVTGGLATTALFAIFSCNIGAYTFHRPLIRQLGQFGGPLIVTALLSTVMHQADRYLIRLFVDIDQVGIYSLAYAIGQGINTLCLLPFVAIWSVVVYEIAQQPDAKDMYVRIFRNVIYGQALILLIASLFARQLLTVMVAPDYWKAAELIPVVCLAYLFFSLHEHFKVPALLSKRTAILPPVFIVAAVTNIGTNILLIPLLGLSGAAWSSVITFATFSFGGLWRYRTIDRYEYPLMRFGVVLAGMIASYLVYLSFVHLNFGSIQTVVIATVISGFWAFVLFGNSLRKLFCFVIYGKNFR